MDEDISQKIDLVNKNIGDLAKNLAGNDQVLEEKLKTDIREIILQSDFKNSNEEAAILIKTLTGENSEANTETIVKAKETSLGLAKWAMKNIEAIRNYRGEDLKTKLVEETKKNNPNITEDHVRLVRRLGDNINRVYNSDGGIEDKKDAVLEEYKKESPGKIKTSWNDTRGIIGLLKQKPKQFKEIVDNHEKITNELQNEGIKLPYQKFDKLASYDRVMSSIKNPELRRFIESVRGRFQTLEKLTNGRFSQISNSFVNRIGNDRLRNAANNFFNKSIVKVSNGFASKIGNQAAKSFVQNSMNTLIKNGINNGMKSIVQGAMKKGIQLAGKATMNIATKVGIKAAAFGLKAAAGAATAGIGYLVMAGWEVLKLGGKFIKKLINTFSFNSDDDDNNNSLVLYIVIGLFVFLIIIPVIMTSTLVPPIESPGDGGENHIGSLSHGEIITEDGKIISCGVGMETDFYRKEHNLMISPDAISQSGKTINDYNNKLKEYVGDDYGTQCGVVYAAQYLAYEFDFWVPYSWGGIRDIGIHPKWGTPHDDGHGHKYEGVDCASFRGWAYDNGLGYRPANNGEIPFGDCNRIKAAIEPGDSLQINGDSYHTSIVLEYNETQIKFAHSGLKSGVTTGIVDICTGRQIGEGSGNNFTHLQKRNYPASRGEQKPDNQITEEEQKPEGETTETGHKTNDKGEFLDLTSGLGLNYSLYLPANYDSQKKYPLLVFLHGWGERGNDLNILYNNSNTIPGILKGGNYYDAIIVSPQSPSSWGSASNYGRVMPLINEIMGKYSVDTERISLTAHSDGVWGLWKIVNNNPGFFSVVVPIGSGSDPDNYNGLTDTKVWSYWMTRDNTQETNPDGTPTTNKSALIEAINSAGGDAKVTRIEGGHGSTRLVYIGAEPVLELMLSQINSNK